MPKFIREYKTTLFKTFTFCSKSSLARLTIKNSSAIDPPHKGSIFFPFVKRDSFLFLYFQKKRKEKKNSDNTIFSTKTIFFKKCCAWNFNRREKNKKEKEKQIKKSLTAETEKLKIRKNTEQGTGISKTGVKILLAERGAAHEFHLDDGTCIPPIGRKMLGASGEAVKHGEVGHDTRRKKREKIAVVRSQRIAWLGHVTGIRQRCTPADKDR